MATHSALLALPPEMLVAISSFVTPETLPTWRLTCKELEAASFDSFIEEFFQEVFCFVLCPSRLRRLHNILSDDHLASRVEDVTLTMRAFDGHYITPSTAPKEEQSLQSAITDAKDSYYLDQYSSLTESDSPDWTTITYVLTLVGLLQRARLSIELAGEPMLDDYLQSHGSLVRDLLDSAEAAGCRIHGIELPDQYLQGTAELLKPDSDLLANIKANLAWFAFAARLGSSDADRSEAVLSVIKPILRSSSKVEDLRLDLDVTPGTWPDFDVGILAKDIFSAVRIDVLKFIALDSIQLSLRSLSELVDSCHSTLVNFDLNLVCLTEDGDPWGEVTKRLATMPRLEVFGYEDLARCGSSDHQPMFAAPLKSGLYIATMENGSTLSEFFDSNNRYGWRYREWSELVMEDPERWNL